MFTQVTLSKSFCDTPIINGNKRFTRCQQLHFITDLWPPSAICDKPFFLAISQILTHSKYWWPLKPNDFLISWMHLESLKAVKYFDLPSLVNHSHHLTHTTPKRSLDRQLTCQFQHFELYDLIHLLARGIFIKIALMQTYLLTFPDMCFWWSFEKRKGSLGHSDFREFPFEASTSSKNVLFA